MLYKLKKKKMSTKIAWLHYYKEIIIKIQNILSIGPLYSQGGN